MDRENTRKSLRPARFPMSIKERVNELRRVELPTPSTATSQMLSNANLIKRNLHVRPTIPNCLRFPELLPLDDLSGEFNNQEEVPSAVLEAITQLQKVLIASYENQLDESTGKMKKGECIKLDKMFPHLQSVFQHECACVVSSPNSPLNDERSGVSIGKVAFCVYIQGLGTPVFVMELMKEVNSGTKSEPIPQAATHYLEFTKCPSIPLWTGMPCVLMACVGADVHTSTAVLFDCYPPTHAACVQKAGNVSAEQGLAEFQSAWLNIRNCVFTLIRRGVADCIKISAEPSYALNSLFPYFTFLTSLQLRFEYTEAVTRGVFRAVVTDNSTCQLDHKELIVKVMHRNVGYGELAHRLLAQWGFAPYLYGVEEFAREWLIVVMEDLCERPSEPILQLPRRELTIDHQKSEFNAIQLLHNAGFVHGDLRDPNILSSSTRVWLIDFDWARPIGEGRYPSDLNKEIQWPVGAMCNGVISVSHDWEFNNRRYEHLGDDVITTGVGEVSLEG